MELEEGEGELGRELGLGGAALDRVLYLGPLVVRLRSAGEPACSLCTGYKQDKTTRDMQLKEGGADVDLVL